MGRSPTRPSSRPIASGGAERLSFLEDSFDAVVSTHALEHVIDFEGAVAELRRVSRSLLIIVVPRERPFFYSLNLHLHFFPYLEAFLLRVEPRGDWECVDLGGDIFYVERLERGSPDAVTS